MKRFILTAALFAAISMAYGQATTTDTAKKTADTVKKATDTSKNGASFYVHYGAHFKDHDTSSKPSKSYPKAFIGITFSRFDLGLAKLLDHGSLNLQPQNQFLNYRAWKTSNVGFDVFQMGVRFSSNFRLYLAAGFDWTLIRLEDNITILKDQPVLTYRQDNIDYSKNRFSSSYLRLPLAFDFRSNEDHHGNRWHFVFGPEGGVLLEGMVKQISQEYGKQKFYNPYNYANFRYGGFLRLVMGLLACLLNIMQMICFRIAPGRPG
jgi:hypothetical protein